MKKARNLWRDLPQGGSRYGSVLTRLFLLLCLLATTQAGWAANGDVLFSQNFNSADPVAYTANTARAYNTSSTLTGLVGSGSNLFTSITCTQKSNCGIGINSDTGKSYSGKFGAYYNNTSAQWSICKTSNFASTAPTAVKITFDALLAVVDNGTSKQAVQFRVGSGFADGITSSVPTTAQTYTGFTFYTGSSSSANHSISKLGSTTLLSGSAVIDYNTMKSYTWVINNTGSSLTYTDPNGAEQTLANQTWDLWMGTTRIVTGTSRSATASSTLSGSSIQNLYIGSPTGVKHEFQLDNVVVTDLTPSATPKSDLTTFAFSSTTGESMTVGDADATPHSWTATYGGNDVSNDISSNVTYVSSNTSVATIVNGKIHAVAAGTTTITAQLSGNATYNNKTTTNDYEVTVSAASSALTAQSNHTWNFSSSTPSWASSYTTTTINDNLEMVASLTKGSSSKNFDGTSYSNYYTIQNSGSIGYFHFKAAANTKITVYANSGGSSNRRLIIEAGSTKGSGTKLLDKSWDSSGTKIESCTNTAENDIWVYNQGSSSAQVYLIKVEPATQYDINTASATGGSFTVKVGGSEVTSATAGTMVTITTTPDSGKEVDAITLSPSGSATKASENNYTFTMPASDVTVTVTFKDATVGGLTPVTDKIWKVDDSAWSSYTTSSEIKANTIVDNIEVIANDGHSVQFGSQQKTFTDGSYTKFWKLGSPGSEYRLLHFKVGGRCKISAYVYQGSNRTVEIRKGGYNGTVIAETDISSSTPTIVSGDYTDNTEADIYVYSKKNDLGVYAIKVEPLAAEVAAPEITQTDGDTYTTVAPTKSVTITTKEDEGTTYYVVSTTAATDGAAIYANAQKKAATGSAESLDLSTYATSESNVIISAVTKKGDNYSDVVTATYTYAGKRSFLVKAADKTLQRGGRDNVDPYITYLDGSLFDVSETGHDLSYYFTFTYERTAGAAADVVVESDGVIKIPSTATPGNTATITITATPTTEGQTLFNSGSKTGTMTVTVKEKENGTKMSFYWDPECTEANQVQTSEWTEGEGKRSVFINPYENGRMIYVKPDPGYEIWVATVSSKTKNDSGLTTPTASIGKYDNTHYSTTHGIPLYISEMSNGDEGTLVIGLKAYKAGTTEGVGSAVSARFSIKQTEAGQAQRPAAPTFSPTKSEAGTLSTAQTVAAVGATNSYVFSKFGSNTLGLGYFINYLEGTQAGREQVATFSTEVGDRDIKALQITGSGNEYYISEYGKVDDYQYNLAAKLLVTPATYYVNVGDAFTAPVLTKITTDKEEEPDASDYSSPTLTGYFYNKQKAEANAAPYQGLKFEEPAGTSLLSYSIQNFNGAGASIDPSTGVVAIGNKSGYAIVTVNYDGGENYTIKTKKVGEKNTTTSPMTATYRINIVDPDEYLPIINPTSRKFANSLDVTISVPDENHYVKYVIANGEEVKTAEQVKAAGETINKNSRVTVTVGENINVGDKVSVYAIAYDDNGVTSTVVKETYEKVKPLQKPTLSPDGVTKPYEYTKDELAVAAVAYNAGAIIYYTTDGSDPTKDGAKTYDGASKILVEKEDGTTIVKAAAYLDGIYSDVVTGTYVPTDDLAQPWFLVNDTKVEGTEIHINTTDVIKISNGREGDGSVYYYTLDGTAPTTTEGQVYNTEGFKLVKTVTASAIATENGLISPATTVTFIINDEGTSKHSFWEAIDETTPEGTMDANDRKVYVTKHTDTKGTSSYIYVENLAATFGGFDNNDWNKTSIGENTQGAAMDGVGKYSIRNIMDVKEETDSDYDPTNMLIGTVHGRTHALPSQGAYVKFEPEKDGVLTIWALQQGGLHYSADGDFCSRFIRFRPVFMVDETGKSIEATKAESTACLSKNWSEVEPDNWLPRNSGTQNGDKNLYYSDDQNTAIYNMYTTWMTDNSISDGGSIKPFEAPASIYPTLFGTGSDYSDVHGYVMPSGGNVKYTFPVKAGKTYFFFGFRTKLGIRGFNFVPTTTDLETVTLPQNADATTFITTNDGKTKNVKLERNVKKNIWTTFCLPFSVSQTQLENIFGEGTQVMQFVNVNGYTMNVFKHYHHMIVAGTPILVKPTNDADIVNPVFYGVHIQNVTPEVICDDGGDTDYKFVGGYTPMTVTNGSYYIGNKDGLWHKLNNTNGSTLNGSRAYLRLEGSNNARALTLNIASFNGEDDDTTTGIAAIESNGNDLDGVYDNANKFDGNIYNLQGQLVRKHAKNLNGLAKGVYIINGKKVVIND